MEFTLSVRSFQVPDDALHVGLAAELAFGTDLLARRGSPRRRRSASWSTIVLMVFFSSRISPCASTVIFCERSPLATAVVTLAMLRTWSVRLPARTFTLSVRSFQVPDTPLHVGLAAELAFGADFLRDAGHLRGERAELVHHRVDGVLQLEDLALRVDGDLLRQVAVGDRGGDLGDVAHLVGEVAGQDVHVVGEVLPGAGDALHVGLAAELAFGTDFLGDARHFARRTSGADRPSC